MNEDEGMDKWHPGPSCILAPCSRIGYKPFHTSHKGRSHTFSFSGWSARIFPSQNIPMFDWAHFTVSLITTRRCFFCVGPEMALIHSQVSWCYTYPTWKCEVPCCHWWEQVWGQECWIGGVHQDEHCCRSLSCSKGSECKL
jgi:hypothetical protein